VFEDLLAGWDGEEVVVRFDGPTETWMFVGVHSTALGPGMGGTRMKAYAAPGDGLGDVLRLSQAMTFKQAAANLPYGGGKAVLEKLDLTGDEATGANIVRHALAEPARRIAQNAGYEGAVIVEQIRTEGDGRGFDAAKGEWVDMVKAGIIDPAKVTRSALQNAASIAAIVLTAESAVVEKPEEEESAPAGGGHMH